MLRVLFIIIAILYCACPDVMPGPIDDALVIFLALSLMKATGGYEDSDYDEIGYESEDY